jgi:hypothetical protein
MVHMQHPWYPLNNPLPALYKSSPNIYHTLFEIILNALPMVQIAIFPQLWPHACHYK